MEFVSIFSSLSFCKLGLRVLYLHKARVRIHRAAMPRISRVLCGFSIFTSGIVHLEGGIGRMAKKKAEESVFAGAGKVWEDK